MGATLVTLAKWTSAAPGKRGKLEYTSENEALLNDVLRFVENMPGQHSAESAVLFKQAFHWRTSVTPDSFQSSSVTANYQISSNSVTSNESSNDVAHLSLQKEDNVYQVRCMTLHQMATLLSVSGDKKIQEVRHCLEQNEDPVALVMGAAYAHVDMNDMDDMTKAYKLTRNTDEAEFQSAEAGFQLMLLLKNLDVQLLQSSVGTMSKSNRMDLNTVEAEFKNVTKTKSIDCLKTIEWTMTDVFDQGFRAPPWRQVHGDIAYITVATHEDNTYYLTACVDGYYQNGGLNEQGELIFEKEGSAHTSLVNFLKEKSPHFNEIVNSQEFSVRFEEAQQSGGAAPRAEAHHTTRADSPDGGATGEQEGKLEAVQENVPEKTLKNVTDDSKKKKERKQKLEQSKKWENLNVSDDIGFADVKKETKTSGAEDENSGRKSQMMGIGVDDDFSESSSESEDEEETADRRHESSADLPSEYWQIQKLVKYLKGGNQTATVISLCAMRDFNLTLETCQLAIRDVGGLDVLINLLDTNELKCKIGSLKILKDISTNLQIRKAIADLGGLQTMVKILNSPNEQLRCLAAETIAHVAKFRRARRTVRQFGGIRKLVSLLDCGPVHSAKPLSIEVARGGALALWSCSKSTKNKVAIRKADGIPLLAKLLKSSNESMLIPVVGTLQECASEPNYRLAIRTEGMIEDLVRNLSSENPELQRHCASAIFKCAEDEATRTLVREHGGLPPLVALLAAAPENKELLAAATGAIWKCAISEENVLIFQGLKAIEQLVSLLNEQPEEVLINVVGALGECAKIAANRTAIRKAAGISPLVNLLTGTNQQLLVNVTKAVGECAMEPENMTIIDRLDGVRLLWSLLKSPNHEVQASAAWAICPCIENAKDAGEMVRSFVGGLELIVSLLKSEKKEVLASVCAAIANIAKDEENLAVITDHGVVPMLAKLTDTTDDRLRHHLAEAIARCCTWGNNRVAFGKAQAVPPLVRYLRSRHPDVHRATAKALHQLSRDPDNCIAMHNSGVVKSLLVMVGASDEILQESAAGCLANIRRLALANEKAKYN